MSKHINTVRLTPLLSLTQWSDGYALYDKTRGMNLAMREKTPQDAFVQTIEYYQERLLEVEKAHKELSGKVDSFLKQFITEENDTWT